MGAWAQARYNTAMDATSRTVAWADGARWTVDAAVFAQVTALLDGLRTAVVGLDPVLNRWEALAAKGAEIDVDALAPTEDDRAIFTAALARAVDEARQTGARPDGANVADVSLVHRLNDLHELFVTDITRR